MIAAIAAQDAPRGAFLTRQQNGFYAAAAAAPQRALELWEQTNAERRSLYMAEARSGPRGESQPGSERTPGADGQRGGGQPPGGAGEPARAPEGGYSGVALGVMRAIGGGEPATMILNVRNGTCSRTWMPTPWWKCRRWWTRPGCVRSGGCP